LRISSQLQSLGVITRELLSFVLITPGLNINKLLAKDENSYMRGEEEVKRE